MLYRLYRAYFYHHGQLHLVRAAGLLVTAAWGSFIVFLLTLPFR